MAPRWSKLGQDGHLEAIWEAILKIFDGLGGHLQKDDRSVKTNKAREFWLHFGVLGGLIFATSWTLLGDLGEELRNVWHDVEIN